MREETKSTNLRNVSNGRVWGDGGTRDAARLRPQEGGWRRVLRVKREGAAPLVADQVWLAHWTGALAEREARSHTDSGRHRE